MYLSSLFLSSLVSLALAQKPEETVEEVQNSEMMELQEQIQELQMQLQQKTQDESMANDYWEHEQEKLALLVKMLDRDLSLEEREAAMTQFCKYTASGSVFFKELLMQNDYVAMAALRAMQELTIEDDQIAQEVAKILEYGLYAKKEEPSFIRLSIKDSDIIGAPKMVSREVVSAQSLQTLSVLTHPVLGEVVWKYTTNEQMPEDLRREGLGILQNQYPTLLSERGEPTILPPQDWLANRIYATSMGVTGSTLLGAVGTWGATEAGIAVGYVGGALLGTTTGYLIAQKNHPSLGEATLMASSVGWGLADGILLGNAWDLQANGDAGMAALGTVLGAGFTHWRSQNHNVQTSNVLEGDFLAYWGSQMSVEMYNLIKDNTTYPNWDDYVTPDLESEYGSEAYNEAEQAYWAAEDEYYNALNQHSQKRAGVSVLGSSLGLALSPLIVEKWNVRPQSALLSGTYTLQGLIASRLYFEASDVQKSDSLVRLTTHATMAGALVFDHLRPSTYEQSIFSMYGGATGYLFGYGVPMILDMDWRQTDQTAAFVSTVGALGGGYLGNQMNYSTQDWVSSGIGLGLSAWNLGMLTSILDDVTDNENNQLMPGVFLTGMGATSLALGQVSRQFDVETGDAIFLGSAAGWGAYYGVLLPNAFGFDDSMTSTDRQILTLALSDATLLGGIYTLVKNDYQPQDSTIPQILGATGATLGALGAMLFTTDSQSISLATLGGATVGLVGGVYLGRSESVALQMPKRDWHLAKMSKTPLHFQMSPHLDQQGDMGVYLGISN